MELPLRARYPLKHFFGLFNNPFQSFHLRCYCFPCPADVLVVPIILNPQNPKSILSFCKNMMGPGTCTEINGLNWKPACILIGDIDHASNFMCFHPSKKNSV